MSGVTATAWISLPPEILAAVKAVPDAATALGEIRCNAADLLGWLEQARDSGQYTGGHLAVEVLLTLISVIDDASPVAVEGAVHVGDCRCDDASSPSVYQAFKAHLQEQRAAAAARPEPGPGMYL